MSGDARSGTGRAAPRNTDGLSTSELAAPQPHQQGTPPPGPRCRFFASKTGCRSGAACPFRHEVLDTAHQSSAAVLQPTRASQPPSSPLHHSVAEGADPMVPPESIVGRHANTLRVSKRPVPQSQIADPRAYQLSQIRRRFTPDERSVEGSTILTLRLQPSDPDFPFEMDALQCTLRVPSDYPNGGKPTLRVMNADMERGYQINVEQGFDRIIAAAPSSTLLTHLNTLDKQLERLLSSEKAATIKIVSHTKKPVRAEPSILPIVGQRTQAPVPPTIALPTPSPAKYSADQLSQAKQVREAESRQIEARLGKLPLFSQNKPPGGRGTEYTIPIEPRKRGDLPIELQAVKTVKLIVPETYNLSPCRIEILGVKGDTVRAVEEAFRIRASQILSVSLLGHLNYLTQNMHAMAKPKAQTPLPQASNRSGIDKGSKANSTKPMEWPTERSSRSEQPQLGASQSRSAPLVSNELFDRPHLITIPRPPEWQVGDEDSDDSSDSASEGDEDDTLNEEEDLTSDNALAPVAETSMRESGVLISFPHLELYGVELLELKTLNITVKCERCKDVKDITKLQNNTGGDHTLADSCKKCASPFAVGYRSRLMHINSVRAGYLDLDGCTVVDMLPSSFIPTCADCSTQYPANGIVSVRGDTPMAFCRECHRKMTFRLPEIKFLRVSASTVRASQGPMRKKQRENLGIVAGQELANRGRCSHYKKSYRWFRFSCCNKVFPCDRCHDLAEDHTIEHANRMLCGFCSREQNYRPKDCGICHAFLTIRPGKGFWEGGQGTRDKVKMSRKDPHKYKRAPGSKLDT
ncbi:hypothetical protein BDV95DRAFT_79771 [Massariosphaeria phaeospora]|uniref:CHY-type domain-containing protein n=1 Tax=Massariosphaeria phaeospora TaxID=100035 RepID=A0A7C8I7U0_9PLEO|nr:hypothetical protein BDV95DRAFT_79771 [Massariosphaeria phaeospora]